MEKMSAIVVLRKFFGLKEGETMGEFAAEIRALSPEEKQELATLAAKEMRVKLEPAK